MRFAAGFATVAFASVFFFALTVSRLFRSASIKVDDLRRRFRRGRDDLLAGNLGIDDAL
ncbi:MAG: hypothetical protein HY048_08825 [Acidobacteria bacterium]|nr:hypothetical protein [Acidobacteriota bacterium]